MDSCFTCGNVNCMDFALNGNIVGCVDWIPTLNIIYGSKPSCYFCDNTHENFDSMNCVYDNMLTLETTEWDTYNDGFNHVTLEVNYCPMCGIKLRKD